MKIFSISVAVLSALLLVSTLICGMWIKTNKITDVSSLDFHMKIAGASVFFVILMVVLFVLQTVKQ